MRIRHASLKLKVTAFLSVSAGWWVYRCWDDQQYSEHQTQETLRRVKGRTEPTEAASFISCICEREKLCSKTSRFNVTLIIRFSFYVRTVMVLLFISNVLYTFYRMIILSASRLKSIWPNMTGSSRNSVYLKLWIQPWR